MDKFGSHSRKHMPFWRMLQDLDMNDYRITSLGIPRDSSDAVTKRWVTQQLKDGIEDIDELEEALTTTSKEIQALRKQLNVIEKDVAKSLPMTGGKMVGGIDMQGHSITNLPLSTTANEPVTKGWYAKNWQDLVKNLTDRVNDLEKEIKGGRSRRELDAITKEDKTLDSIKTTLENRFG
ncbi:unnamed protein product [Mytilus edulis]|uniref:Uncharacterized protein n=1 Tax=Mytilus edulis TaxID=6550 RepID=A0A8S3T7Z2_MYTED|nr:unnamed protein product [Mytilus edulis]